jgi:hypothetical protein
MDWEKVGQAFSGGANVLASGMMDKYQRKIDSQEQQKRDLRDQIKAEFDTDPELRPIALRAHAGEADAQETVSLYAGLLQTLASGTPFTEDHYKALAPLPPMTKSRLIGEDLKLKRTLEDRERQRQLFESQEETRKSQREHQRKLEQRWEKEDMGAVPDESNIYDYRVSQKAREEQKRKDILAVVKEINELNSKILSTRAEAERAGASKTKAGYDPLFEEVQHLAGLRDEAIARRDALRPSSARQAQQKWATEGAARTATPSTPATVAENIALTPEDMKEIAAAKAARPDLSEEAIIKAYVAYKRKR